MYVKCQTSNNSIIATLNVSYISSLKSALHILTHLVIPTTPLKGWRASLLLIHRQENQGTGGWGSLPKATLTQPVSWGGDCDLDLGRPHSLGAVAAAMETQFRNFHRAG